MHFKLKCNGTFHEIDVDPEKPLLWVIREDLQLNGTKFGCGIGYCGTCNVLLDGELKRSCRIQVKKVGDREIRTIEGLDDSLGTEIKDAWVSESVSQCGYCQPGQIISAYSLLSKKPTPSEREKEDSLDTLCRCGTYQRVRVAVETVSSKLNNSGGE